MIVYNNQEPNAVNNVGQFGATEGSIGAYKQAAEYAADAKYWALLAESKFGTVDDLIAEVEKLYKQGILLQQDIEDLKQDFKDQDARLMQLIAQTNAAVANANNSIALINQKLIEVDQQLDILLAMKVTVTTLPPGSEATGSFNNQTGEIKLGIPEGEPGRDGSVTDLNTAPSGTPVLGDIGFYVDADDNKVYKTTLSDIANLIPSVRSIKVNDGPEQDGDVVLTLNKNTVGLGNVLNVAQYSRQEINDKFDKTTKTYQSKAEADLDAQYRQVGEKVLVWDSTKYEFYTVAADKTLTPVKTEGRILTVNSRAPDSTGNIDITIPTGNPSLYLGEMVMFPYDPTKAVSYPGILPADGRLVSKESALDLGPSLVSGQLPVVSETEWQAGARQYFSWGKLADGITDADSTNFVNIRLPDWTGGEAIRSPDSDKDSQYDGSVQAQKPYVVTVNNQAPDEITGNVNLTRSIFGAASSGANSDITSLAGLTTALSIVQGGTGATTTEQARINLGVNTLVNDGSSQTTISSPDGKTLLVIPNNAGQWKVIRWNGTDYDNIPLSVVGGGTGASDATQARANLGLGSVSTLDNIPVEKGGTGASTAVEARANLGLGSVATLSNVPIASGGTGAGDAAGARFNLGLGNVSTLDNVPVTSGGTGASDAAGARINIGALSNTPANTGTGGTGARVQHASGNGLFTLDMFNCYWYMQPEDTNFWVAHGVSYAGSGGEASGYGRISYAIKIADGTTKYVHCLTNKNTITDTGGFIKAASPVVNIYANGQYETNDESEGVSVIRQGLGEYLITGCLGLNSDARWGGVDGGFEIPTDRNKQPRIWLDYEVKEDGSISVKTYHRTHPTSPVFARNEIKGFSDGDPIDIPSDAFISVRVEMPTE